MENSLKAMDLYINDIQPSYFIPILLKKYLQINGKVIGFNVDPAFNNCLDALIMVKISDLPEWMLENLGKDLEKSQINCRFSNITTHLFVQSERFIKELSKESM